MSQRAVDPATLFGGVYKGRRVLLTGHTGFKGSWIGAWLADLGAEVVGYSLDPPTDPSLFEAIGLQRRLTHVVADVRDRARLAAVFDEHRPEIVIHMAAQPLVRLSYEEPAMTYETNVMGTVNVLEAARACPSVRVVLNVTSDKCYENREWVWAYRENDPMGGFDPYSSSKGCSELVTAAYGRSFFGTDSPVRLASARAGNVIGGGDWAQDRIVPDCVRALAAGQRVVVRNPEAIRPWQHVLEPLSGYLWLAARMWHSEHELDGPWNFGPASTSNVPVKDIVAAFLAAWGEGEWSTADGAAGEPHEATFLKLDCTKSENVLAWRPVWDVSRAIEATARWYRAYQDGASGQSTFDPSAGLADRTAADIEDYTAEAARLSLAWARGS